MGNLTPSKLRELTLRILQLIGEHTAGLSADALVTALQNQGYSEDDASDAVFLVLDKGEIELGEGLRLVISHDDVREPEAA